MLSRKHLHEGSSARKVVALLLCNSFAGLLRFNVASIVKGQIRPENYAMTATSRRQNRLAEVVNGQVIVVTGGSSGIGLATAKAVAAAGAITILVARSQEALRVAKEEVSKVGNEVYTYQADLTDFECLPALVDAIIENHGAINILINNAGRSIRRSVEASYDRFHDFERTIRINYFGALSITLLSLPPMIKNGGGHIINISSIGVQANAPRFSAYVASKAALDAFTRCAAAEFLEDSIKFTTVSMPLVKTPMTAPTKFSRKAKLITAEKAAVLVTRAIVRKPSKLSTVTGSLAQIAYFLLPNVMLRLASKSFRRGRDSDAARGEA